MSERDNDTNRWGPEVTLARIDSVCDAFEEAWRNNHQRPDIAAFLAGAESNVQEALFAHLLELDIDYRRKKGETPSGDDYRNRFQEFQTTINAQFPTKATNKDADVIDDTQVFGHTPKTEQPLSEGRLLGDYELLDEIARGGMGVVYRAKQQQVNRIVALKMILAGTFATQDAVQRFYTEAEAAANLDHPAIVPIYDVGELDGLHYFTMGFVEGESLSDRVRQGPLEPREAARLVKQIGEGVSYAHRRGIVHRDLKPANVLIDTDDKPKITDFGLAKNYQSDSGLTATGQVLGTPSFMPPEQARGDMREVGPPADVYSLGATLYHLLTGRPPFIAASLMDTLQQVLHQEPAPPAQINPAIDKDLETICLKCLQKDPSKRYASADDLVADLEHWLRGEPIRARPVGRAERAWRWCKRNPVVAGLLSAFAASLLIGTIVSTYFAIAADDRAKEAQKNYKTARKEQRRADDNAAEAANKADEALREKANAQEQTRLANLAKARVEKLLFIAETRRYASQVQFAVTEIENNNIANAREILSATEPKFRSWEYGYYMARCDRGLYLLEGHGIRTPGMINLIPISQIGYSPDGKRIASACRDGTVKIWDAQRKKVLWHLNGADPRALTHRATAIVYSPDGKFVASCGMDRTIRIWDAVTGKQRSKIEDLRQGSFQFLAIDLAGRRLATVSRNGIVVVWDIETGKELARHQDFQGKNVRIAGIAFTPDGKRLVVSGTALFLIDAEKGLLQGEIVTIPRATSPVVFLDEGSKIACGCIDGAVHVVDVASGKPVRAMKTESDYVSALAVSPDGKQIAAGGRLVNIWDADTGILLRKLSGRAGTVNPLSYFDSSLAFHPDGKHLAVGGGDSAIRVWNLENIEDGLELNGHENEVYTVAFSGDSKQIVSCGADRRVIVWDVTTLQVVRVIDHPVIVVNAKFHPRQNQVATLDGDGTIQFWNVDDGKLIKTLQTGRGSRSLAFSRDGKKIVSGNKVFNVDDGKQLLTLKGSGMAFSADGLRIAGAHDTTVKVWNAKDGKETFSATDKKEIMILNDVIFFPDGKRIVAGFNRASLDAPTLKVWNLETGKAVLSLKSDSEYVISLDVSPDGKRIVTAGIERTVKLFDAETGERLAVLRGQKDDGLSGVAFSPDGKRIASCGEVDDAVHLWEAISCDKAAE